MNPSNLLLTLFTLAVLLIVSAVAIKKYLRKKRRDYIQSYVFPSSIRTKLAMKHTGLSSSDIDLTLKALRQYFLVCLTANAAVSGKSMGMPSRVVDDAWHEFILISRAYGAFCTKAFGTYLHHAPESTSRHPGTLALQNTLAALREEPFGRMSRASVADIPLLFGIDRALGIQHGFYHDITSVAELQRKPLPHAKTEPVGAESGHSDGRHSGCGSGAADSGWSFGGDSGGGGGGGGDSGGGSSCGGGGCSS